MAHRRATERHREDARRQGKDATAEARAPQGERPREGRASFPRDQAPVRPREGALPRATEEHGASADTVRAVESLDGAQAVDGDDGSSPSEGGVRVLKGASNRLPRPIALWTC